LSTISTKKARQRANSGIHAARRDEYVRTGVGAVITLTATSWWAISGCPNHARSRFHAAFKGVSPPPARAGAFFSPSMMSLKPVLVVPESRQKANATLSLLQTTCLVIGPAAGGATVAAFGPTICFVVNALSYPRLGGLRPVHPDPGRAG
jgi:hypothetical protein